MVELVGVTKTYPNGAGALRGVDLTVQDGEFVYLIGPSGAGKSSLLRLLYREERPTRGTVVVDGVNVGRLRPGQVAMYRRRIGVIFQDFRLLPQWSVYKNVAFALRVTGASPREIRRRVGPALDEVGLWHKRDVLATQLSGGEQQRVAIARAMVHRPRLLLADEPTGNLDPVAAREVHRILLDLNARGTTVIMATHASHLVDDVRRRVVALDAGRVVRDARAGGYAHGG
ncbi:MAG: cell division ATP-binding protein FtsE [Firmicutes bacterium]|nr:cell division ATP-binding protein FtsE [Bacillota bacterium]